MSRDGEREADHQRDLRWMDKQGEVTLCWKCSNLFGVTIPKCPFCESTNANVDFEAAMKEVTA